MQSLVDTLKGKIISELLDWYCMRVLIFTDGTGYACGEIDHDEFFEGVLPPEGVDVWRQIISASDHDKRERLIKLAFKWSLIS